MNPYTAGIGLAIMIAGPPLYGLVTSGDLDGEQALQRGGLIAAGCVAGAMVIQRIVDRYDAEQAAARRRAALGAAMEQARALQAAASTDPDQPPGTAR